MEKENNDKNKENQSFFGPNFRKWLRMKRELRLVHEEIHPKQIYPPRIQYKVN